MCSSDLLKKSRTSIIHSVSELELECTVTNLPESVEVDVSDMDVGDVIHASEVKLPKDTMVLLTDPDAVVANLIQQAELEETDESAEAGAAAAPEVITEKKEED